jgi:hypothetical protein
MGDTFTVLHTAAFVAVSQALAGGSFWPQGGRIEMRKGRPADGLFLLTARRWQDLQPAVPLLGSRIVSRSRLPIRARNRSALKPDPSRCRMVARPEGGP